MNGSAPPPRLANLELNVGMPCNNRCVFCMSGSVRSSERSWLPLKSARAELRRFRRRGCRSLGFLGGEPTAYPHILDCVRYARALGYRRIALCSNGTKYADARFVSSLVEAGVTRFGVSIHSHRPQIEDALTGLPGNFARKLAGLRHLRAWRDAGRLPDGLSLNPVLSRRTLPELDGFIDFFVDEGLDDIRFNFIWPQARVETDRTMIPTYREAMPVILRAILRNERRRRLHLTFGAVPRCMLRLGGAALSPALAERLGRRYLSERDDLPTAVSLQGRERFDWQERKRDLLKTRGPGCAGCRHLDDCDGVWKSYAALHGLGEPEAVR